VTTAFPRLLTYAERAAFYDLEAGGTFDNQFLVSLLTPRVGSVLEIPCGNGKNTVDLIRPDLRVTAVDREPNMLARVRERLAGLPGCENLETVAADLRDLDLGRAFDLVIVQREAFQLVTGRSDASRALASLRRHLAPQGTLMIDIAAFRPQASPDPEQGIQPSYFDPALPDGLKIEEWTKPLPWGGTMTRFRTQRHEGEILVFEFSYQVRHPSGESEEWTAETRFQLYTRESFLSLARDAGLVVRESFRNYRREPYREGDARMICLFAGATEGA